MKVKNFWCVFFLLTLAGCGHVSDRPDEAEPELLDFEGVYSFNLVDLDILDLYSTMYCRRAMEEQCSTRVKIVEYDAQGDNKTPLHDLLNQFKDPPDSGFVMYCYNGVNNQILFSYFTFITCGGYRSLNNVYGYCLGSPH